MKHIPLGCDEYNHKHRKQMWKFQDCFQFFFSIMVKEPKYVKHTARHWKLRIYWIPKQRLSCYTYDWSLSGKTYKPCFVNVWSEAFQSRWCAKYVYVSIWGNMSNSKRDCFEFNLRVKATSLGIHVYLQTLGSVICHTYMSHEYSECCRHKQK